MTLRIVQAFISNGFVLLLGLMILLAFLTPGIGAGQGAFSLHSLSQYGVWLIFFFYGVGMSVDALCKGLANWRLPIIVHFSTFILFPLLVLAAYGIFATESYRFLWIGLFYVAALPSTVSSSVVMVSLARGNIPAAIFNASLSSLLGVILTPLWMGLFLTTSHHDFDLPASVRGLMFVIVLPIVLGMLCHSVLGAWQKRNKKYLSRFDQSVILLIVYTSFCDSFAGHAFENYSFAVLLLLLGAVAVLFFAVYGILNRLCRILRFNQEDTITVLFCGSKKSLMHGTAMAPVLFAGMTNLGVVLLPIMFYHAFQLIIVSVLAQRFAQRTSVPVSK